jgi:hypothetical protein
MAEGGEIEMKTLTKKPAALGKSSGVTASTYSQVADKFEDKNALNVFCKY